MTAETKSPVPTPTSIEIQAKSPQGYLVTIRTECPDSRDATTRLQATTAWLDQAGYRTPIRAEWKGAGGKQARPDPFQAIAEEKDSKGRLFKACPVHKSPAWRHSNAEGKVWYSHRLVNADGSDGAWCNGLPEKMQP